LVCLVCCWCSVNGQPLLREKLVKTAESQVGVRERTGHNDGVQVESYLDVTGLGKGYAWCAAFLAWCHEQNHIKNPRSAYSPDWFRTNVVYSKLKIGLTEFNSKPGQVFGLYFESKRRVAHVGMITGETKFSYLTIEGNTNEAGSREGDGVYRKIRNKRTIFVISDYIQIK
jgi:hypothetical protein